MPGFTPFGMANYFYRIIVGEELEIEDLYGNKHFVRAVTGMRNDTLEKLRAAKLSDPSPRATWYISKEPPYYYGRKVSRLDQDGNEILISTETYVGHNELNLSYQDNLKEMIDHGSKMFKIIPTFSG